ncbi:DUF3823 domain-containing protein [Carboxylicivirga caseinilyticus]|uniref:DUF3823 domain-containing protein n=1 Tax=Carboxylicivirga caseinilyticus TaxID=3417572 RepID=UPI003D34EDEC|nr:DUF3823 domain-containing protein [Marinilabiliaceae bacterium A049]
MKKILFYIPLIFSLIFMSCEKDNYDAPSARLYGKLVYQGEAIHVEAHEVTFQLWEPGWQLSNSIQVDVNQDGEYSAMLFPSTYKLIIPSHQGPFRNITNTETQSDTIIVNLGGNKEMDIEVEPYYMIRNAQFSQSGGTVSASFGLEQIITDEDAKSIERVNLYINTTQFVDVQSKINSAEVAGGDIADLSSVTMSVTVPETRIDQSYVYARVGVKMAGVEDMIFTAVQKIDL